MGVVHLERDWRRLYDLWLAAEIGNSFHRRRGDASGVLFWGIAYVPDLHRGDICGLLADETRILIFENENHPIPLHLSRFRAVGF